MSMGSNAIRASDSERAAARAEVARLTARNAELEKRLRRLSEALQRAEAVSHVVAGVVHDFRNSLTVVLGEANELLEELRGCDTEESAQAILEAGTHAAALSRDLLALAREQKARPSGARPALLHRARALHGLARIPATGRTGSRRSHARRAVRACRRLRRRDARAARPSQSRERRRNVDLHSATHGVNSEK